MTQLHEDCLDYSITENWDLVVSILNEEEVEHILHTNSSDLHNFYYLTDQQKEEWGFYFTTLAELGLWWDVPAFVEHWYQTDAWNFYYSWRIWIFNEDNNYSALAELLYHKNITFEFLDRIVDIENIEDVAKSCNYELSHTDKYNIYELIMSNKYDASMRYLTTFDFINVIIRHYLWFHD